MTWLKYLVLGVLALGLVVWFGLPRALTAMGLHPHFTGAPVDVAGKRALVITTSHATLGEGGKATGVFGSEMSVPYYAFLDAGMEVDIASIKGGAIPVEPWSMGWPLATEADTRFKADAVAMAKLTHSIPVEMIDPARYDLVYMAGGWGAAYDLGQSAELGRLITAANANGAILGSVCHGALGFLQAKNPDGSPLLEGRRVTGVSDQQVKELGIMITPLHPERELRAAGALYEKAGAFRDVFANLVVVDGNLVTGQNQNSGAETAWRMMDLLAAK
jgi:putative intracellular protease/amidase